MADNVLITGGAGFIGRWAVKAFLDDTDCNIFVLDDFSNGMKENLAEFRREPRLVEVKKGRVQNKKMVRDIFNRVRPALCVHLAAQINVQDSIDYPDRTFETDVRGTFVLLEACREAGAAMAFMSTCMVYDLAAAGGSISETDPVLPRSPYAAAKLAGEHLAVSYHHAYGVPVVVMRPFNTYGPHQKATGEGGVVSIFTARRLQGEDLNIFGTGRQTRDLLYVEDCADFILRASLSRKVSGRVLNAATGEDVTVNMLARKIADTWPARGSKIRRVKHIHPQSEIMKLCGNPAEAKRLLGWHPKTSLDEGLLRTGKWIQGLLSEGNKKWL